MTNNTPDRSSVPPISLKGISSGDVGAMRTEIEERIISIAEQKTPEQLANDPDIKNHSTCKVLQHMIDNKDSALVKRSLESISYPSEKQMLELLLKECKKEGDASLAIAKIWLNNHKKSPIEFLENIARKIPLFNNILKTILGEQPDEESSEESSEVESSETRSVLSYIEELNVLIEQSNNNKAWELVQKARKEHDNNSIIFKEIATIAKALGKKDEELSAWKKALELEEDRGQQNIIRMAINKLQGRHDPLTAPPEMDEATEVDKGNQSKPPFTPESSTNPVDPADVMSSSSQEYREEFTSDIAELIRKSVLPVEAKTTSIIPDDDIMDFSGKTLGAGSYPKTPVIKVPAIFEPTTVENGNHLKIGILTSNHLVTVIGPAKVTIGQSLNGKVKLVGKDADFEVLEGDIEIVPAD